MFGFDVVLKLGTLVQKGREYSGTIADGLRWIKKGWKEEVDPAIDNAAEFFDKLGDGKLPFNASECSEDECKKAEVQLAFCNATIDECREEIKKRPVSCGPYGEEPKGVGKISPEALLAIAEAAKMLISLWLQRNRRFEPNNS